MKIKQIAASAAVLVGICFYACNKSGTPPGSETTSLTVTPESLTLQVGETAELKVETTPVNAPVEWITSDESVASLKDGVITALKAGQTEFMAASGQKVARVSVTVTAYKPKTFPRKVLAESFTGIGCGACEIVADPFYDEFFGIPEVKSKSVFLTVFYGHSEHFSLPEFKEYARYWGGTGMLFTPGLMLNRLPLGITPDQGPYAGKQIPMINIVSYAKPKEFRRDLWNKAVSDPGIVSVAIKPVYDAASKQLSAEVSGTFSKEALEAGRKYYVTVVVKEDGIQNPKPIQVKVLNNVVTAVLTEMPGDPVKIGEAGAYTYKTKVINYAGNPEKSKIVAFINAREQDIRANEVYNAEEVPVK